jgi:hypothetical protein
VSTGGPASPEENGHGIAPAGGRSGVSLDCDHGEGGGGARQVLAGRRKEDEGVPGGKSCLGRRLDGFEVGQGRGGVADGPDGGVGGGGAALPVGHRHEMEVAVGGDDESILVGFEVGVGLGVAPPGEGCGHRSQAVDGDVAQFGVIFSQEEDALHPGEVRKGRGWPPGHQGVLAEATPGQATGGLPEVVESQESLRRSWQGARGRW